MRPENSPGDEIRVVHLDDDPFELERVHAALTAEPAPRVRVDGAGDAAALPAVLRATRPDIVLLDLHLRESGGTQPGGLALVPLCRALAPEAALVVLSVAEEPATVRAALSAEIDDYLCKTLDGAALRRLVVQTVARRRAGAPAPAGAAAAGATLRAVAARVPAIVVSAIGGVHIYGESGTGKEVVADLFRAGVAPRPFISVNCAAIPATLVDSTLFGCVRGAYTGASADRKGYLEAATGGWLFLDEVACLGAAAQAALLRAIESQEIIRVGDSRPRKIAVRLLSATNEDLRRLVADGRFRLDLWQRLAEAELVLPPLRERRDEIPELVDHLVGALPGGPYSLTPAARRLLCGQDWREGNVRQLRNCLRAMTERHVGGTLTPRAIPAAYRQQAGDAHAAARLPAGPPRLQVAPSEAARPYAFARLAGGLFVEAVKALGRARGRLSIRQIAAELELSKSSVSRRLAAAVADGLTQPGELDAFIKRRASGLAPSLAEVEASGPEDA